MFTTHLLLTEYRHHVCIIWHRTRIRSPRTSLTSIRSNRSQGHNVGT